MTDAIPNKTTDPVEVPTLLDHTLSGQPRAELPVDKDMLAPLPTIRSKTVRSPGREAGDAFDRAFAALEEALRERDVALAKPMPAMGAPAPLIFRMPEIKGEPVAKMIEPAIMPMPTSNTPAPGFVAPAFERVSFDRSVPAVEQAAVFERVDAIIAMMQKAAAEVAAAVPSAIPQQAPAEGVVFVTAKKPVESPVLPSAAVPVAAPAPDEHELMPFGAATLRMMVM